MKTICTLAVFILLLGTDAAEYGAAEKVGFNLPRNGISVTALNGLIGHQAFCGGWEPPYYCGNLCGSLGYRCYQCTAIDCRCLRFGC
ncbi:hypothetical protein BDV27DRAFT_139726 [Aspergillus caelatus]|uniref:Invertebrate defensins family profile domain-containing protein n=1 Tax=Aspergillus caelatus TaxID=61420 RepID=A0A5N6ZHW9_9EURO|nr:uncharacterized protein BDV27DRAFT_139726 [Aspergillus caelatus]KAE8357231.1 hypothetical protein BDV27DRAFT_139726 [Aspergillus caelatus]